MKKDTEWLKEEIRKEMELLEPNRADEYTDERYKTLGSVARKLDKFKNPETLSQEWIDSMYGLLILDEW